MLPENGGPARGTDIDGQKLSVQDRKRGGGPFWVERRKSATMNRLLRQRKLSRRPILFLAHTSLDPKSWEQQRGLYYLPIMGTERKKPPPSDKLPHISLSPPSIYTELSFSSLFCRTAANLANHAHTHSPDIQVPLNLLGANLGSSMLATVKGSPLTRPESPSGVRMMTETATLARMARMTKMEMEIPFQFFWPWSLATSSWNR